MVDGGRVNRSYNSKARHSHSMPAEGILWWIWATLQRGPGCRHSKGFCMPPGFTPLFYLMSRLYKFSGNNFMCSWQSGESHFTWYQFQSESYAFAKETPLPLGSASFYEMKQSKWNCGTLASFITCTHKFRYIFVACPWEVKSWVSYTFTCC